MEGSLREMIDNYLILNIKGVSKKLFFDFLKS